MYKQHCIWNANGSITCDKACNDRMICRDIYEYYSQVPTPFKYSINVIVTSTDKSIIFHEKQLPAIDSSSAYVLDTIHLVDQTFNYMPALVQIQDLTDYRAQQPKIPPLLQILVKNSRGQTHNLRFDNLNDMNILTRTNTIAVPTIGGTEIIMDRRAMGI